MLNWLEKKFGRYAIPHVTIALVLGQAVFYLAVVGEAVMLDDMALVPVEVQAGEWWRLLAFLFLPAVLNPIFIIFALYLLWLMGTALEQHWGAFRYNIFLLVGYLATIGSAWLFPTHAATNIYLLGSIFLAFAFLYPDFQLLLFFIIPVKVKWLAGAVWVIYGIMLLQGASMGQWMQCVMILAAVANFLLFFARDLVEMIRRKGRRIRHEVHAMETRRAEEEPFHRCTACGRTEQSDPELEFRYCPECSGAPCYCMDHIFEHEHK